MKQTFKANGKLLITGEYFVLDGALALALPTKQGQSLTVESEYGFGENLYWSSLDCEAQPWFKAIIDLPSTHIIEDDNEEISATLHQILFKAQSQNLAFLHELQGLRATTNLDFPREWGLGTSSTLIHCIAEWAQVDAFKLLADTMGGSGYDIACAGTESPLLYQRQNDIPTVETIDFKPSFTDNLYFVYLGKKQNSRLGIKHYRKKITKDSPLINEVTKLTYQLLAATTLTDFEKILLEHELFMAKHLDLPRAKDLYFNDYWGVVKSLGAWGGDFVLVSSNQDENTTRDYFYKKGFDVFLKYHDLIF